MHPSPASRHMEGNHCIKCASLDCTCPRDDSEHWAVTAEKTIAELRAKVERLQKEVAWWAGEGQEDRPEIIEWRRLVEIDSANQTLEQRSRIREIARMIHLENAEQPELRAEVERLKDDKLDHAILWAEMVIENALLRDVLEAKDVLLMAYRTGNLKRVGIALDVIARYNKKKP